MEKNLNYKDKLLVFFITDDNFIPILAPIIPISLDFYHHALIIKFKFVKCWI